MKPSGGIILLLQYEYMNVGNVYEMNDWCNKKYDSTVQSIKKSRRVAYEGLPIEMDHSFHHTDATPTSSSIVTTTTSRRTTTTTTSAPRKYKGIMLSFNRLPQGRGYISTGFFFSKGPF